MVIERLLGDRQSASDTYSLIPTILIPTGSQRVAVGVGNCGAGVSNIIPDLGNNGVGITMGVGDGGVDV